MNNNEEDKSQVNNPCSGAGTFGLGGALCVAIGSAIRDNDVHNEAMTFLAGGAVTGAIAGLVGCCVPKTNKDSNTYLRFTLGVINSALGVAAFLTAPLMGEKCLGLGTDWGQTVVDELIGSATIIAGTLAVGTVVATVGCCAYGTQSFFSKGKSLFGRSAAPEASPADQSSSIGMQAV